MAGCASFVMPWCASFVTAGWDARVDAGCSMARYGMAVESRWGSSRYGQFRFGSIRSDVASQLGCAYALFGWGGWAVFWFGSFGMPVKLGCDELWSGRACCDMLWPVAPVMVQQGLGRRVNSRSVVAVMARQVTASCSQLRCARFGCAMPVQFRHVLACLDTLWFVRPVKQKTPEEILRGLCFKSSTLSRWSDRMLSGYSEPSPGNTFLS